MAHEIAINREGKAEAAFAIEKPWHKLGVLTEDLMSPSEALGLANMEWTVSLAPLYTGQEFGGKRLDKVAVIRDDTLDPLGVVSSRYTPVQNHQQVDIIEALIGEGLSVSAVGSLFGGRQTFWTCKCPSNLVLSDGDAIEKYLILSNGHDGGTPLHLFWSPIRVVCNNTLRAAIARTSDRFCIRHKQNIMSRIQDAQEALGLASSYYDNLGESFELMKRVPMNVDQFIDKMLYKVLDIKKDAERKSARIDTLIENFKSAPGAERTVFGGYNAFTFFTSHQHVKDSDKRDGTTAERRFDSIQYGAGKALSERAYNTAVSLAAA